jgi:integrase/recombinase XerC
VEAGGARSPRRRNPADGEPAPRAAASVDDDRVGRPRQRAARIQLEHFDLYRKTLVVTGKGDKQRSIPVPAELTATVDEYLLTEYPLLDRLPTLTDFLWYAVYRNGRGVVGLKPERRFSYRGFYEWWRRVEKAAGVRHRKPHMTRHTFSTDVRDATEGDLYAVKELLGHSSTHTTEVYLHSSRTRTESAIRALAEYRTVKTTMPENRMVER